MPVDDHVRAFARHADVTTQRVGSNAASVVANSDPCDLIIAVDHPCRSIGCVMDLHQVVGGVHIRVGGVRIHLLAVVARRHVRRERKRAIIFIVLEENPFVGAGNKIPCRNGWDVDAVTSLNPRQMPREAGLTEGSGLSTVWKKPSPSVWVRHSLDGNKTRRARCLAAGQST